MGLAYYASKVLVKEQIAKVGRRQSPARPHPLPPLPERERWSICKPWPAQALRS